MTISKDLMLAILAMDSYNRGYDAGLSNGTSGAGSNDRQGLGGTGSSIGTAEVIREADIDAGTPGVEAGFYALAYDTDFGTVVSYRGTDFNGLSEIDPDVTHGWSVGAGNYFELQALRAAP
jgi:hypothetical protein